MDNRLTRSEWALALAKVTAKRSTCCRRQVGCVLLDKLGHVLATGYNGVAAGLPHCNDREGGKSFVSPDNGLLTFTPVTYPHACPGAFSPSGTNLDGCYAIHAEQNALLQCRDVQAIDTCFVTASPCMTCTKLLLNTSCSTIVFDEIYPHSDAQRLWTDAGRVWTRQWSRLGKA